VLKVGRLSKPLLAIALGLGLPTFVPSELLAQERFGLSASGAALPDAPQPQQNGEGSESRLGAGSIIGTVLDTNRDVLQGVRVTLLSSAGSAMRSGGIWR